MNLMNRIKKLYQMKQERADLSMPDFNNYTNEELTQHITKALNRFHIEDKIKSYEDAERRLTCINKQGLISDKELSIYLQAEKHFWELAAKSPGAVVFIESYDFIKELRC